MKFGAEYIRNRFVKHSVKVIFIIFAVFDVCNNTVSPLTAYM